MTQILRRLAATLLLGLGASLPASATTFSTDFTDIWFVPSESGWGINLIQQGNTLFATLFVYGPDRSPRWYVGSELNAGSGTTTFTGSLNETSGTPFSAPWTGSTSTPVGSMTIAFSGPNRGTLVYTVNGVQVTKIIERFAYRLNDLAGNYLGGMTATASNCGNPANNGAALIMNELTVQHGGGNPRMVVDFTTFQGTAAQCVFTGAYQQQGKLGLIQNGTFNCTGGAGNVGTFTMSEIHATRNGFSGAFTGQDQFCRYNGFFGGTRDVF